MNLIRLRRREDELSPLARLRNSLDRFLDYPDEAGFFGGWMPNVDIREDKDKLTVEAELPGMKKEDIDVSIHENTLILSGERKCESERKDEACYQAERYYGRFHRAIGLPFSVDADKVHARYKDGVLTLTLPKSEKAKPKQINVEVS